MNQPPAGPAAGPAAAERLTLPCGAEVDLLLEQVADGRAADLDATSANACTARPRWPSSPPCGSPVTELAGSTVPRRPGLTAAVMSQIRVLVRDVWYTLQTTDLGAIRIAARIVAALARDAPGWSPASASPWAAAVTAGSPRSPSAPPSATAIHTPPSACSAAPPSWTSLLPSATATRPRGSPRHPAARHHHPARQLGLKTVTVNVTVDDILTDDGNG